MSAIVEPTQIALDRANATSIFISGARKNTIEDFTNLNTFEVNTELPNGFTIKQVFRRVSPEQAGNIGKSQGYANGKMGLMRTNDGLIIVCATSKNARPCASTDKATGEKKCGCDCFMRHDKNRNKLLPPSKIEGCIVFVEDKILDQDDNTSVVSDISETTTSTEPTKSALDIVLEKLRTEDIHGVDGLRAIISTMPEEKSSLLNMFTTRGQKSAFLQLWDECSACEKSDLAPLVQKQSSKDSHSSKDSRSSKNSRNFVKSDHYLKKSPAFVKGSRSSRDGWGQTEDEWESQPVEIAKSKTCGNCKQTFTGSFHTHNQTCTHAKPVRKPEGKSAAPTKPPKAAAKPLTKPVRKPATKPGSDGEG